MLRSEVIAGFGGFLKVVDKHEPVFTVGFLHGALGLRKSRADAGGEAGHEAAAAHDRRFAPTGRAHLLRIRKHHGQQQRVKHVHALEVAHAPEDDGVLHPRGVVHALRKPGTVQRGRDGEQEVRLHLCVRAREFVRALAHLGRFRAVDVPLLVAVLRHELECAGIKHVPLGRALPVAGLVQQFLHSLFDLVLGTHRTHPPLPWFRMCGCSYSQRGRHDGPPL